MKRRTDASLSPQKIFDELLYSSLDWPWKTIRLERNSLVDYRQRSMSNNISVAELYHENSKLNPLLIPDLTASFVDPDELRREFIRRRATAVRHVGSSIIASQRWRQLSASLSGSVEPTLLYAVDLLILSNDSVALYEPVSNTSQVFKKLSPSELDELNNALQVLPGSETELIQPVLFILGNFARNEFLYGARGYRRTLLEAGRVVQAIRDCAKTLNLDVGCLYDFTDRDVDSVLECDGTELGTLAALTIGDDTDVG